MTTPVSYRAIDFASSNQVFYYGASTAYVLFSNIIGIATLALSIIQYLRVPCQKVLDERRLAVYERFGADSSESKIFNNYIEYKNASDAKDFWRGQIIRSAILSITGPLSGFYFLLKDLSYTRPAMKGAFSYEEGAVTNNPLIKSPFYGNFGGIDQLIENSLWISKVRELKIK